MTDSNSLRELRDELEERDRKRRGSVFITLLIILIFLGAGLFYIKTSKPTLWEKAVSLIAEMKTDSLETVNDMLYDSTAPENDTGESGEILKSAQNISFDYVSDGVICSLLSAPTYSSPLDGYTVTSDFGTRTDPVTGEVSATHHGIDLAAPAGSEIHAVSYGTVTFAGTDDIYGKCVRISHSDSLATFYAHLSRLDVSEGDAVRTGDCIGIIGSTGKSTGIHLHFEVISDGERVDPMSVYEKI